VQRTSPRMHVEKIRWLSRHRHGAHPPVLGPPVRRGPTPHSVAVAAEPLGACRCRAPASEGGTPPARGRRQRWRGPAPARRPRPAAQPLACCASAPSGRPDVGRDSPSTARFLRHLAGLLPLLPQQAGCSAPAGPSSSHTGTTGFPQPLWTTRRCAGAAVGGLGAQRLDTAHGRWLSTAIKGRKATSWHALTDGAVGERFPCTVRARPPLGLHVSPLPCSTGAFLCCPEA